VIPKDKVEAIADRLAEEIGIREDVGNFVYYFAALPAGHDLDYALDALKTGDDGFRRAVNIVLEGI
jgi:hypothetical protein